MNAELQSLNHQAAQYGWDLSTQKQSREEFTLEGLVQLAQRKTAWLRETCEEGANHRNYGWPYDRAYYLLCRGSRNTPEELSEMAQLFSFIQRIYTETLICIPGECGSQSPSLTEKVLWNHSFVRYPVRTISRLDLSPIEPLVRETDKQHNTMHFAEELTCFHGEPDLERIMTGEGLNRVCSGNLNHETILRWAWESWRMAVGPPMRQPYARLIDLMNMGCLRSANHGDVGQCWREDLEVAELRLLVDRLWRDVKPFYQKLHSVVRHFLRKRYASEEISEDNDELLPAHLLGGMWSHSWTSYVHDIIPHSVDIDRQFATANWSSLDLVRRAEDIYASMGLSRMSEAFWKNSIIGNASKDGTVKCHGSAANMFADDAGDLRMIVCPRSESAAQDFYVTVHEMGHIVYYMEASKQPTIFRDGTSAAFQEALGDSIYLAAVTPQHLVRLGILDSKHLAPEKTSVSSEPARTDAKRRARSLNSFDYVFLLRMALAKIPTIPFEYLMDSYRWNLFDGSVNFNAHANDYFWFLLEREQGIRPPSSLRARKSLFDAGAVFHLSDNTPFVRYFLASFISYQIYEGLCKSALFGTASTHPSHEIPMPLHRCDLYGSKKAGKLLRKTLSRGASVHWTDVLEQLTGDVEISAESLLRYYQPLDEFLDQFIEHYGLVVGWN
ncbi:AGAP007622-PA-like protein [Anopheles sinensis]|uniref:Angiotensin-converting enzyme n=1 Tax=Anopheles sinensis TaxID=74873 RepID=A0A084VWX4_ANOSI|nr:AGAP007622-PA-like protein [Anopheles sinensis]